MAMQFADWLAICNVKARYCRLLDSKDWEGWTDLFTPDCQFDTPGTISGRGPLAFVASVRSAIETARTAHQVHSPEMELDGDSVRVVWAMQDRVETESQAFTGYGHYTERYRRCEDGNWRICALKLTRLTVVRD